MVQDFAGPSLQDLAFGRFIYHGLKPRGYIRLSLAGFFWMGLVAYKGSQRLPGLKL